MTDTRVSDDHPTLHLLAENGTLAAAAADPVARAGLRREAFVLVWPLVYQHHTRPLERRRGHARCARSVGQFEPTCHDGFLDDVLAVVEYVLAYAKSPIANLEGWVCSRIAAAVVDGHRRRRGSLGAQQRPRVPKWLITDLDEDPWSIELARRILEWVGVRACAGAETWPLSMWAEARASATGEWHRIGDWRVVREDVERVCATMRRARPGWYQRYVEQPLRAKQGERLSLWPDAQLVAVPDRPDDDQELIELAGLALDVIAHETEAGADPTQVVPAALLRVFPGGWGVDDVLAGALHDPHRAARITDTVLQILSTRAVAAAS